jgi:parallel beta-helix repeat protein
MNHALHNGTSGFSIDGADNTISSNQASHNALWGIEDGSSGSGAEDTANFYVMNNCVNNGLADSNPSDLCLP